MPWGRTAPLSSPWGSWPAPPAPTAGRFSLATRSPLTGTVFDGNSGGLRGVGLKRCRLDALPGAYFARMLEAVTGVPYNGMDLHRVGERIWNLGKMCNLAVGLDPAEDTPPPRLPREPVVEGPASGQVVRLDEMLPPITAPGAGTSGAGPSHASSPRWALPRSDILILGRL